MTYRSKVNLELKGSADADFNGALAPISYHGKTRVEIPLPAQLVLATGYKFSDFTLLLAFERTYWSKFKDYDFEYDDKTAAHSHPILGRYFKAYSFGTNYKFTPNLELGLGYLYQHRDKKRATDIKTGNGSMSGEFDASSVQIAAMTFKYSF